MNSIIQKLNKLVAEHPDAQIVTDIGASMLSGWEELSDVVYHPEEDVNTIELIFEGHRQ